MLYLGPLRVDPVSLRVYAAGGVVRLRPKAATLLILLASRPGETFLKDELLDALWPDKTVDEKNLAVLVGEIRRALAPFLGGERAVTTIPGGGYRLTVRVSHGAQATADAPARSRWTPTAPSRPCVLVLPFRTPQPGDALAGIVASINASLTTRLAAVATVILSDHSNGWGVSAPAHAGCLADIEADLLVTGSVFAEGERIRINIHVLDAVGRIVLWADQITAQREQLFDAEDRLCERTLSRITALGTCARLPVAHETEYAPPILHAYRLGCHFLGRRTAQDLTRARDLFGTALESDERFAPALAGLAQCSAVEAYYTDADPRACAERAVELSARALEIDGTLSQAFAASGFAYLNLLEWDEAAAHLRQALALDPRNVDACHYYSEYLTCSGRHEEAIRMMRLAVRLEPTSRILNSDLGKTLMLAGRLDEAAEQLRSTVELDPDFPLAHYRLGLALACLGRFPEARQTCARAAGLSAEVSLYGALRACCEVLAGQQHEATEILHRLKQRGTTQPGAWYGIALVHLERGEKELALDTLREAVEKRAPLAIYAQVDPLLDGLRGMRGFQELLVRTAS